MTLFGNRIFPDKRISGRDAPGFRRTLNPITSVLRRERQSVDTHKDHVKMEAVDTHRDHVRMKMWLNGSDAATSQQTPGTIRS